MEHNHKGPVGPEGDPAYDETEESWAEGEADEEFCEECGWPVDECECEDEDEDEDSVDDSEDSNED